MIPSSGQEDVEYTLGVLYEDPHLICVDKPPGLLVHRSSIAADVALNALQVLRAQLGRHVYPVHRLDRPTSGALLFALDPETQRAVNDQFAAQAVRKSYLAVARGFVDESGLLEYPLSGRDDDKKREDITGWRRLATAEVQHPVGRYPTARYSAVSLSPRTGRWHQLRRHCAHLRHPIVGDTSHGDGAHNRFFRDVLGLPGLFLHAESIALSHPISGEELCISAPCPERFLAAYGAFEWRARGGTLWKPCGHRTDER